ncbi:hypothetical protein NEILACOT_03251 [Neisseria lactamica ATCC 23970]|uniref:Uncharacterized protein n=1 Tax=Neisseria lactamica ATCC 23970 TaxID=546265 RepID=D0W6V9_NEILA|nr:hypothetical protein NEILACOT_03251 [Neisseria lactamica ATCC 23970]
MLIHYIVIPAKTKNQKLKFRHSRAGGNLGLSVRKLIGKNGFSNPETPDSCFRRESGFLSFSHFDKFLQLWVSRFPPARE